MDSTRAYKNIQDMRKWLRWGVLLVLVGMFIAVMSTVFNPYGDRDWLEISHGNHSHYVPRGWDGTNLGNFPTRPPGPNEIILPDGRVVPK